MKSVVIIKNYYRPFVLQPHHTDAVLTIRIVKHNCLFMPKSKSDMIFMLKELKTVKGCIEQIISGCQLKVFRSLGVLKTKHKTQVTSCQIKSLNRLQRNLVNSILFQGRESIRKVYKKFGQ